MQENKQIEEHIAVIEIEKELCGNPCDICKANNEHCMPHRMAKKLAAKGYRKASEVAMEIFEEIDKTAYGDMDFFKMLKKKYESEGADKVKWSRQEPCPMTAEQFNAIYDDESEDTE